MLKEMTIKIITEQDEEFFDSLIRERLFGSCMVGFLKL
jgi:hypothetical protein